MGFSILGHGLGSCSSWPLECRLSTYGLVVSLHLESSKTRDGTHVPCIGRQILNHWTTREIQIIIIFNCKRFLNIEKNIFKMDNWISLVVQWLRICLPMQETQVPSLVQEDLTYCRTTKSMYHNYWSLWALEPTLCNKRSHSTRSLSDPRRK